MMYAALPSMRLAILLLCIIETVPAWAADNARLMDILVSSYPNFLARHEGDELVWKDGTRTKFDDGKGNKSFDELLNDPSPKDMFYYPYPTGGAAVPAKNADPGRIRYEPLFTKMYGDCRKGQVQKSLVEVVWLPRKWGHRIQVTRINGVAEKLAEVSRELDRLPASFDKYLIPPAGTFNCRAIAGTARLSAHGTGTAIDIATRHSDYWRWGHAGSGGSPRWHNAIPDEIVRIFERHGFIWGGRWYHFDTMHFEYRPEILKAARSR